MTTERRIIRDWGNGYLTAEETGYRSHCRECGFESKLKQTKASARGAVSAHKCVAHCPHGCGPMHFVEDQWYCWRCGDEWSLDLFPKDKDD